MAIAALIVIIVALVLLIGLVILIVIDHWICQAYVEYLIEKRNKHD